MSSVGAVTASWQGTVAGPRRGPAGVVGFDEEPLRDRGFQRRQLLQRRQLADFAAGQLLLAARQAARPLADVVRVEIAGDEQEGLRMRLREKLGRTRGDAACYRGG